MNAAAWWQSDWWHAVTTIPGTKSIVSWYLQFDTPGHLLIETLFVIVIVYLLLQKSYKPSRTTEDLTEAEIDQLCHDWNPEPLIPPISDQDREYRPPIISSAPGTHVIVNGKPALNFATLNFLGFAGNKEVNAACSKTLVKYGVGACGPRGFYGTIDVHLDFEAKIANFMGAEAALLYSYDILTVASAIPAFCKRGDLILCDLGVSYAVQSGCVLSRSDIIYFKHNDMDDLERLILEECAKPARAKVRKFIVVEGLYQNYGDVAPLKRIVELRKKYKCRVVVDETLSIGVLGATGRGCTEHCGVSVSDIDVITAGMGHALGSVGGFCVGSNQVVDHQRLAAVGYCFSASLPPFLATAAIEALTLLEAHPELPRTLVDKAVILHSALSVIPFISVTGSPGSPVLHVRLVNRTGDQYTDRQLLQRIVDEALVTWDLLLVVAHYSTLEKLPPPEPSIRISVTAQHTDNEIHKAASMLASAIAAVTEPVAPLS